MTFHHWLSSSHPRRADRYLMVAALVIAFLLLAGCAETGQMEQQPRYDSLGEGALFPNGQSARLPVPGTVPYASTLSPNSPANTGQTDNGDPFKGWPVTVDQELVQLGQERYNIYCTPCHGPNGEGNGKAVGFGFPKPPNLLGDSAKTLANGEIFLVIQYGSEKMFPYGYRVKPHERWAIIAYIRAMQLRNGAANPQELTPDQIDQIGNQQ